MRSNRSAQGPRLSRVIGSLFLLAGLASIGVFAYHLVSDPETAWPAGTPRAGRGAEDTEHILPQNPDSRAGRTFTIQGRVQSLADHPRYDYGFFTSNGDRLPLNVSEDFVDTWLDREALLTIEYDASGVTFSIERITASPRAQS
jgi:hypothetical protein